jgi:prophage antirepressor-like protein
MSRHVFNTKVCMSDDLIPFDFDGLSLRAMLRDGDPWFVAGDACRALDLANVSQAVSRLDDDERTLITGEGLPFAGITLVSESGLYSLILVSRKPEAKRFKKWVTKDVIPSIRKTGSYGAPDLRSMLATPESAALALAQVIAVVQEERTKRIAAEADVVAKSEALAIAEPKAAFVDEFVEADGTMGFRECVKILHRRIAISEEDFSAYLIHKRYAQRLGNSQRLAPATYGETQGYVTSRPKRFQHRISLQWMVRPEFRITARGLAHFTIDLRRAA